MKKKKDVAYSLQSTRPWAIRFFFFFGLFLKFSSHCVDYFLLKFPYVTDITFSIIRLHNWATAVSHDTQGQFHYTPGSWVGGPSAIPIWSTDYRRFFSIIL